MNITKDEAKILLGAFEFLDSEGCCVWLNVWDIPEEGQAAAEAKEHDLRKRLEQYSNEPHKT